MSLGPWTAERVGGVALIGGGSLIMAGNVLHPRTGSALQFTPVTTDGLARLITDNLGLHYLSHAMLIVGPVIWTLGFLVLYRMLVEKDERIYSLPSILSLALSTVLFVVVFLIDGFVNPVLSLNYLAASGSARESARAILEYSELLALSFLASAFLALFSAGGLFGASLFKARLFHRWLGWAGIALGLFGVVGYVAGLFGPYWIFSPWFPPYSLAFTVWAIVLGTSLYRGK